MADTLVRISIVNFSLSNDHVYVYNLRLCMHVQIVVISVVFYTNVSQQEALLPAMVKEEEKREK